MFIMYGRLGNRLVELVSHQSKEIVLSMCEEHARKSGLAVVLHAEGFLVFEQSGGRVNVHGAQCEDLSCLRRTTKAVLR